MAEKFQFEDVPNYQETQTYRQASPERRRQLNRYKKECGISDEHMLLMLYRQDLEAVPEGERTGSDTTGMAMLVIAVLLLWNTLQSATSAEGGANVFLIFLSLGSFLLVCCVYYLGLLNPYKRAVRKTDKALKAMPEVPDFVTWDMEHPDKEDRRAKAGKAERKGRTAKAGKRR